VEFLAPQGSTPLQKTGMFESPEVSYHQTYSGKAWLSILKNILPNSESPEEAQD